METIIRITGKGKIKVRPDMTRVTVTLSGRDKDYAEVLQKSAEATESMKNILERQGFQRDEVRTLAFHVMTRNESYQEEDGQWRERFAGYEYRHALKVEFDSDNARLGRILGALVNETDVTPELHLSYFVKDRERAKNQLLGKAMEDARTKAEVLTAAANVELKGIVSIDYSWGDREFEVSPVMVNMLGKDCKRAAPENGGYRFDIEPDDVEVSDTVTVVWSIA